MVKLSSKGQLTIPADIRAWLGVQPGDKINFTTLGNGKALLQLVPRQTGPGMLGAVRKPDDEW